jgi:AmmeMemoRadiSam system protein A
LRGCIGTLEAYQPLVQDVCEHAVAAAFHDYRFSPLKKNELSSIEIEISYLTPSVPLIYSDSADLLRQLNPDVDGVVLSDGFHRATYLPQVWEQLPDKREFLSHLCLKMGLSSSAWLEKRLQVDIYKVIHFSENE